VAAAVQQVQEVQGVQVVPVVEVVVVEEEEEAAAEEELVEAEAEVGVHTFVMWEGAKLVACEE